jgi:hypothetical protein
MIAMQCEQAQQLLLLSDDPHPDRCASPELAEHLRTCPACRTLAEAVCTIEQAWRALPVPAAAECSRDAFLASLPQRAAPRLPWLRQLTRPRWLAAAALLLAVGLGTLFYLSRPAPEAAPDVVERLIDLNLALTQAASREEQQQILGEKAATLKQTVEQTKLPAGEHDLAQALIANAAWLAEHDDPATAAERFTSVADKLLGKIDAAASAKTSPRLNQLAESYRRITEVGVTANLERAQAAVTPQQKKKLERALVKEAERAKKLAETLERMPDATQKQVRHVLEKPRKEPKNKKSAAP